MTVFQVFKINKYSSNPLGAAYGTEFGKTEYLYSHEFQKYFIL